MSGDKQKAFLSEVKRLPGVVNAAGISHALFGAQKSGANMTWKGKDPEQEVWFEYGSVGYDMLELLEIEWVEGRSFSKDFGNEENKMVINRATKNIMAVEDVIGSKFFVNDSEYEIIGVTEDFHFQSLHERIKPTFFLLNPNNWYLKLAIKIQPQKMRETINYIDKLYSSFNPGFPFEYSFHEQDQAKMYASEDKITLLTKYASGLAILISSLGLFGLVSFVTERKAKEMGVRKVLGASSVSIVGVILKEFMFPIAASSVIGVAASALLLSKWLNEYAYRIELTWWFFAVAILLMILIALLTSISHIMKSVIANPIHTLRDE